MNSKSKSSLAIPFITYTEGQGFNISKEAYYFLHSLPYERELGIVSIVGKYRTGKSFFVNRVLLDQKKGGFQVGPTINPCTKGLWLWKKTLPSSSNSNMDIILIDTEGFGGMDENANHDSRIFLFSLLLSSFFIYNSVGSIDENALNTLNLIINLAKDIQTKTNKGHDDSENFPSFLWVVRDFTLQMVDKHENRINSKEYLENALEFQKGNSDAIENKNKIRRLLKHFFQDRDCEVMYRPSENEKDLQRLDEMDNSQLRPYFLSQVELIRSKVYRKVKPKRINNILLNGRILVNLCRGYMETINKGLLPNVESAWFYVCRNYGIKAIQDSISYLYQQISYLGTTTMDPAEIIALRSDLRQKVLSKFKKRSLGSEEGHPDLMDKLEKKIEENLNELAKKNKAMWNDKFRAVAEEVTYVIREKIYSDKYDDFSDFVQDFEYAKHEYDSKTGNGDLIEKWKHFNELSESLYRLAGETITTKINKNLHSEKVLLQQKMQQQYYYMYNNKFQLQQYKYLLKSKVYYLYKQNGKQTAISYANQSRINQYKSEHDKLYDKYRNLYNEHEQSLLLIDRLKRYNKKAAEGYAEYAKSEMHTIKTNMYKYRALYEMEKKYMQYYIERYKYRCNMLDGENKKMRTSTTQLSATLEYAYSKYEYKAQEVEILEQTNNTYSKKIENLLAENSRKSELMSDHSEWMLEKAYLYNQISFLKNTLNENKRLHDALLVALQQSLSSSEGYNNNELFEANKSLSSALEKMDGRYKMLYEKYERMKEFKKVIKNCISMQCGNCNKWIQTNSFNLHLEQCLGTLLSLRYKTQPDSNKESLHITVSQMIVKEAEDKKKPFTYYIVQVSIADRKWKVSKRYKEFIELQQLLINKFPTIKYPPSCNFLADINNLVSSKQKNMMAEERRKSLQQYLRDLAKIDEVRESEILKEFLQLPDTTDNTQSRRPKDVSYKKYRIVF